MQITLFYRGIGDGVSFTPIYPLMFKKAFEEIGVNCEIVQDSYCYDYMGVPADNLYKAEYQNLLSVLNKLAPEPMDFKDFSIDFRQCPNVDVYGTTTSSGCKYKCKFCPNKDIGFKTRDKNKVIEELKWLCENTNYFEFFDNNVLLSDIFFDVIKVIPPYKKWGALINIEEITGSLKLKLKTMFNYGCRNIYLGLETFNEDDLIYFGKPYVGKVDPKEFMKMLQDIGFNIYAFIIRGLPNETEKSFEELTQYLELNNIRFAISRFTINGESVLETPNLSKDYLEQIETYDAEITEYNLKMFLKPYCNI